MMTKDEFLKKYHSYNTKSEDEARAEARAANELGIENDEAIAVNFGTLGWGLMLKSAYDFLPNLGQLL